MKNLYLISTFIFALTASGQNLVVNGSFEQYTTCPQFWGQISATTAWSTPSAGSPDYFNVCAASGGQVGVPVNTWGYQAAKTGSAYVGLNLVYFSQSNFREYLQGSLSAPLVANKTYQFQMYLNLANVSQYATDDFQVYFSPTKITGISGTAPLSFVPQISNANNNYITDTTNWVLFSAPYTAAGGEMFFLIGNFKTDAATTTTNTNPQGSQTNGYVYVDDVSLISSTVTGVSSFSKENMVSIFPNPFQDNLRISNPENASVHVGIYDLSKRLLFEKVFESEGVINTEGFASGIYIYEISSEEGLLKRGKINKE
jgi:predicted secreted protein